MARLRVPRVHNRDDCCVLCMLRGETYSLLIPPIFPYAVLLELSLSDPPLLIFYCTFLSLPRVLRLGSAWVHDLLVLLIRL